MSRSLKLPVDAHDKTVGADSRSTVRHDLRRSHYTSLDIALLAGVSQSTVSRALNGSRPVQASTRKRILDIAASLDYHVDLRARHLRTQQTGALTLLMFADPALGSRGINSFLLSMIGSITQAANRRGFDLIVSLQQLSADWHADYLRSRKSDGLILLGYGDYCHLQRTLRHLVAQRTRFVRWGIVEEHQPGLSVGSDNVLGAVEATNHLVSLGRERIAFIGDRSAHSPEFRERYRGYCRALREAGLRAHPALCVAADLNSPQAGAEAVQRLLDSGAKFDAIVAASDQIALSAMSHLGRSGMRVPEDIAVVGFDDLPISSLASPSLTSVRQDTELAGERLVQTLIAQIDGKPAENGLLRPELIVRESCGSSPSARTPLCPLADQRNRGTWH